MPSARSCPTATGTAPTTGAPPAATVGSTPTPVAAGAAAALGGRGTRGFENDRSE